MMWFLLVTPLPLGAEVFGTGAIIGTTLGGFAVLIAFTAVLLLAVIYHRQR